MSLRSVNRIVLGLREIALASTFATFMGCDAPLRPEGLLDVVIELETLVDGPMPRWELSAEEAMDLARLFRSLQPLDRAPPVDRSIGFRSFRIHNPEGDAGIPQESSVSGDYIRVIKPYAAVYGNARNVERLLVTGAKLRGFGHLLGS